MAMDSTQQLDAYQFFIIAFGAAPGTVYMDQLDGAYDFGMTTKEIVNVYTTKPQFTALYPNFLTDAEFATSLVNNVVKNSASDAAKAQAMTDIEGALASGMTRGDVIYQVFTNLANLSVTDEMFGGTVQMFKNQIAVAEYYTETLLGNATDIATLRAVVSGVTAESDTSSPAAIAELLAGPAPAMADFTVGQDDIDGNAANNLFEGVVVQNALGSQVNTLGSGDKLDGGAGTDTLNATITSGVFAGGSYSMPIQPKTANVEIVKLEAVSADIEGREDEEGRENSQVYVNAKDMTDVEQLWSSRSDADLIIQNLTTKGLDKLSDMTIGMEYTGNADTRWGASDYNVYFDQDYLTPENTSTNPSIDIEVMNEDAYDVTNGDKPLAGVFFRELQITLNKVPFDLATLLGEDSTGAGEEIQTYAELLAALQVAVEALKDANPGNAALQTLEVSLGPVFTADRNPETLELRTGTAIRFTVDGLTDGVPNELKVASTDLELARADDANVENNNRYERVNNDPAATGERLAINIALEKVGLAGDGGELVIGSMNKHEYNEWDSVNTVTDTTSGIEEFNVIVYGANDKSSSLAGLHSTNNNLRVVTVTTDADQTGTYADLTIGNSNTSSNGEKDRDSVNLSSTPSLDNEYALKDVQIFDASALKGELNLYAALTDEVTDKYLDLKDEATDEPELDNVAFEYTGGTGNDYFNIALDSINLDDTGTVTREDMTLNIDGGAGDDTITLAIVDDEDDLAEAEFTGFEQQVQNWYDNQKLNENLSIDGGAGDDTIWTPGSGDVIIDAGTGNDTVYADNTDSKAVWAYNVETSPLGENSLYHVLRNQLNNLQSDANDGYKLYNGKLTVNFQGFEATVTVPSTMGMVSDLQINQAIKLAVNSNPVLSKLLVATDGPANSLVIKSLIDGDMDDADLTISLAAPAAVTASEQIQLNAWYGNATPGATVFAASVSAFNAKADYDHNFALLAGNNEIDGRDSDHVSDNTITGGLGNDVLVLGTGFLSNDTVVYEGFDNGTDTIVNFETDIDGTPDEYMVGESEDEFEVVTVSFATMTTTGPGAGTSMVTFDGVNVDLENNPASQTLLTGIDVAYLVADVNGLAHNGVFTNWTAEWVPGTNQVVFTSTVPGNVAPLVPGDFAWFDTDGAATIVSTVDGTSAYAEATAAEFVIDLDTTNPFGGNAADKAGVFAFEYDVNGAAAGGVTTANISYAVGEGAPVLADRLADTLNAGADWDAVDNLDGTVTVTKAVAGAYDLATYAFTATTSASIATANGNALNVGIASFTDGTAQVGTAGTVYTLTDDSNDYLDFSSYGAKGVLVDGVLVAGVAAAVGQTYITLTEGSGNKAGQYTIQQYTEVAAGDVLLGLIGVADFGEQQDFVAENFII